MNRRRPRGPHTLRANFTFFLPSNPTSSLLNLPIRTLRWPRGPHCILPQCAPILHSPHRQTPTSSLFNLRTRTGCVGAKMSPCPCGSYHAEFFRVRRLKYIIIYVQHAWTTNINYILPPQMLRTVQPLSEAARSRSKLLSAYCIILSRKAGQTRSKPNVLEHSYGQPLGKKILVIKRETERPIRVI